MFEQELSSPRVAICTLTRFPEIFEDFAATVDRYEPQSFARMAVTSGGARVRRRGWIAVEGKEPFCFARNANIFLRAAAACDINVLLSNDDVRFTGPIIEQLHDVSCRNGEIGLIAPQVDGGADHPGLTQPVSDCAYFTTEKRIPFVCVLLPARTLQKVGLLDERFDGYGGEDDDYCRRILQAGLKLAIAPRVPKVIHGYGDAKYSSSFLRVMTSQERQASMSQMLNLLNAKYTEER